MIKRIHILWGIFAATVAGIGTLGAVGIDAIRYRPVWFYEHAEVAEVTYSLQLHNLKQELYQLKLEADKMRRSGEPVPEWLRNRIWELEQLITQVSVKLK